MDLGCLEFKCPNAVSTIITDVACAGWTCRSANSEFSTRAPTTSAVNGPNMAFPEISTVVLLCYVCRNVG